MQLIYHCFTLAADRILKNKKIKTICVSHIGGHITCEKNKHGMSEVKVRGITIC